MGTIKERFWGLERDKVAAEQLHLDVERWTITMMANMLDIFLEEENPETEPVWDIDEWATRNHAKDVALPRYIQFVGMMPMDGEKVTKYGIIDFRSIYEEGAKE